MYNTGKKKKSNQLTNKKKNIHTYIFDLNGPSYVKVWKWTMKLSQWKRKTTNNCCVCRSPYLFKSQWSEWGLVGFNT